MSDSYFEDHKFYCETPGSNSRFSDFDPESPIRGRIRDDTKSKVLQAAMMEKEEEERHAG